MTFKTDQEAFWAGEFGTEYIQRNQGDALLAQTSTSSPRHCAKRTAFVVASSSAPTSA